VAEEIVAGYRLVNCMMVGQTSEVWEVVETSSHRHFAMKRLIPNMVKNSEYRHLLLHEADVGKQLAHQNVIRIFQVGRDGANVYFIMEYFPAGSLKLRLLRKQYDFVNERIHSILKQAATGLAYMNASGWVHRDVKPDNMLVNSAGELRLIDFALAQRASSGSFLSRLFHFRGKIQGTRSYMSPEQIRGQPLDGRADIYSFGVSAFELVAHRLPFVGSDQQELLRKHILESPPSPQMYNKEVTDEFADLVMHMMAKKAKDRPESFHEVLQRLKNMKIYKNEPAAKGAE